MMIKKRNYKQSLPFVQDQTTSGLLILHCNQVNHSGGSFIAPINSMPHLHYLGEGREWVGFTIFMLLNSYVIHILTRGIGT